MTKALAILKEGLDFMNQAIKVNPNSVKELQSEIDRYVEAIKELEELNNRSCESCRHYKPQDYDLKEDILDQWICCDEIYAETRYLVNFKKFYCSRYEAKGE